MQQPMAPLGLAAIHSQTARWLARWRQPATTFTTSCTVHWQHQLPAKWRRPNSNSQIRPWSRLSSTTSPMGANRTRLSSRPSSNNNRPSSSNHCSNSPHHPIWQLPKLLPCSPRQAIIQINYKIGAFSAGLPLAGQSPFPFMSQMAALQTPKFPANFQGANQRSPDSLKTPMGGLTFEFGQVMAASKKWAAWQSGCSFSQIFFINLNPFRSLNLWIVRFVLANEVFALWLAKSGCFPFRLQSSPFSIKILKNNYHFPANINVDEWSFCPNLFKPRSRISSRRAALRVVERTSLSHSAFSPKTLIESFTW